MLVFMGALGEAVHGSLLVGRPELTPELADALVDTVLRGWSADRPVSAMTRRLPIALLAVARRSPPPRRAEPLSRAQAVARALEANPDILRSLADHDELHGRAQRGAGRRAARDQRLRAAFRRYRDPGFLNSPNFDQFPPELHRRPSGRSPTNLWDGYASAQADALELQLGKAIRAAQLRDAPRRREHPAARTRPWRCAPILAYNDYLLALERVKVAEQVGAAEGEAARDDAQPPRRRGRDRPRGAALRGRPRERARTTLAAPGGRGRARPRAT